MTTHSRTTCHSVPRRGILTTLAACLVLAAIPASDALTPAALDRLRKEGGDIKLIDVRLPHRFQRGSIPGAMNIPAAVLLEKKLPPLGNVILFSDGLGDIDLEPLLAGLNQREGVSADGLEGGYSAWREFSGESTEPSGLRQSDIQMISYKGLLAVKQTAIMLDLRKGPGNPRARTGAGNKAVAAVAGQDGAVGEATEEADALQEFCKPANRDYCRDIGELRRNFGRKPAVAGRTAQPAKDQAPTPLIVLVDDDHQTAYAEYRKLKLEGYRRVVVLAGGDLTLRLKGQSGFGRVSGAIQGQVPDK